MKQVHLLRVAVVLMILPVLLGELAFVVVGLVSSGSSNPQAMGRLATTAPILSGMLIMLGLVLGSGLGLGRPHWVVARHGPLGAELLPDAESLRGWVWVLSNGL